MSQRKTGSWAQAIATKADKEWSSQPIESHSPPSALLRFSTSWFARDPIKAAGERFFFFNTFTWIAGAFLVIHFKWYEVR